jgi:GT2 family glycosyltransferase
VTSPRSELEELRHRYEALRATHQQLRNRRSVRLALSLAALARPLFALQARLTKPAQVDIPQRSVVVNESLETEQEGESPGRLPEAGLPALTISAVAFVQQMPPVTILIPVFNAYEELEKCINALLRNTNAKAQILLIDDASTDPRVDPFLQELAGIEGVTVLSNEHNLGFVRTVNRGFGETVGDVVILNSDAEVTPRWLENLTAAAYQNPLVGTVTPLSDNAGAFSAPEPGVPNDVPPGPSRDDIGRLVTRHSARRYPSGPTGNGYCMYLKRAFLDTVGQFDAEHFPRGYGEENDLCMRGLKAGWQHIIDDATYIFHHRSASFGEEKEALLQEAQQTLARLHPDYRELVREFLSSESVGVARARVGDAFDEAHALGSTPLRTRVLYVIHAGVGGTPETNADLMEALDNAYECFLLLSDTRTLRLFSVSGRELGELESVALSRATKPTDFHDDVYWDFVMRALLKYGIELVHIRHLFKHTLDITKAAQGLRIPVVLSFHDYYYICPTIHLLDDQDRYCAGSCTDGQGVCRIPDTLIDGPHLKHFWVYVWRDRMKDMFEEVDAFVTATQSTKDTYLRAFPELVDRQFNVIEHGREIVRTPVQVHTPSEVERIRIVVPGTITVSKGIDFIRQLKELDDSERLEFHFLGPPNPTASDLGTLHGPYQREGFGEQVAAITPHFIGLFSIWAETYSHTLTEAWSLGIPVIASELGALGERIRAQGGGWLVDPSDVEGAYETILSAANDSNHYRQAIKEAQAASIRSVAEMRDDYDALYRGLLQDRLTRISRPDPG